MNGESRRAIRKRNRLLKIHSRSLSAETWERYRAQRKFHMLTNNTKKNYYVKLNSQLSYPMINTKNWWGVKSMYGQKLQGTILSLVEGSNSVRC